MGYIDFWANLAAPGRWRNLATPDARRTAIA
jgi:hypothetical protein